MEPNSTDQRLTELEIKASFTEDLLDNLTASSCANSSKQTS